jgi:hypothetical protein
VQVSSGSTAPGPAHDPAASHLRHLGQLKKDSLTAAAADLVTTIPDLLRERRPVG